MHRENAHYTSVQTERVNRPQLVTLTVKPSVIPKALSPSTMSVLDNTKVTDMALLQHLLISKCGSANARTTPDSKRLQ